MKKCFYLYLAIYFLSSIFNGSTAQCFPDRHSTNWYDGWISCIKKPSPNDPTAAASHWILYDFKTIYKIDQFKIWNTNDPDHLDWGSRKIDFYFSEDSVQWKSAGQYTLTQATGKNNYEGEDWQSISIPRARYILIRSLENFAGNCHGFSEVKFAAEKIKINTSSEDPQMEDQALIIKLSPNPSKYFTVLEIDTKSFEPVYFEIINAYGQKMYSKRFYPSLSIFRDEINTREWPSGTYFLQIVQSNVQQNTLLQKIGE